MPDQEPGLVWHCYSAKLGWRFIQQPGLLAMSKQLFDIGQGERSKLTRRWDVTNCRSRRPCRGLVMPRHVV